MHFSIIITAILLLFFSIKTPPALKVYLADGNIEWHSTNGQIKKLSAGDDLTGGKVHVKNGKVIFFDEEGNNLMIKEQGKYDYKEIIEDLTAGGEDISAAFFKYTWKKMNKKKEKPEGMSMLAGGVVDRGKEFQIILPADSSIAFTSSISIEWNEGNYPYQVQLYDQEEKLIETFNTDDQKLNITLKKENYSDNIVLLIIKDNTNSYTDYVILYLYNQ